MFIRWMMGFFNLRIMNIWRVVRMQWGSIGQPAGTVTGSIASGWEII